MFGFLKDVHIDIRPVTHDAMRWEIAAREVSYEIQCDGLITLRIDTRGIEQQTAQQTKPLSEDSIAAVAGRAPVMEKGSSDSCSTPILPAGQCDHTSSDRSGAREPDTQVSPLEDVGSGAAPPAVATSWTQHSTSSNADRGRENRQEYDSYECATEDAYGCALDDDIDHHSARTPCSLEIYPVLQCTVIGCTSLPTCRVPKNDKYGRSGLRCKYHAALTRRRCEVEGCERFAQGKLKHVDKHGSGALRCLRHGAPIRRCNVDGCVRFAQGKVAESDHHGPAGKRCMHHNASGRQCNVEGCHRQAKGKAWRDDKNGRAGPRCRPHGSCTGKSQLYAPLPCDKAPLRGAQKCVSTRVTRRQCDVDGCTKFPQGKVYEHDDHGAPGKRCFQHGAPTRRCNVIGCATQSAGRISKGDRFGPAGRRCTQHRGSSSKETRTTTR